MALMRWVRFIEIWKCNYSFTQSSNCDRIIWVAHEKWTQLLLKSSKLLRTVAWVISSKNYGLTEFCTKDLAGVRMGVAVDRPYTTKAQQLECHEMWSTMPGWPTIESPKKHLVKMNGRRMKASPEVLERTKTHFIKLTTSTLALLTRYVPFTYVYVKVNKTTWYAFGFWYHIFHKESDTNQNYAIMIKSKAHWSIFVKYLFKSYLSSDPVDSSLPRSALYH